MKNNLILDFPIKKLGINSNIINVLNKNNINTIRDVWNKNKPFLKEIGLSDKQINQIIIKLQLLGLDLNKHIYKNV